MNTKFKAIMNKLKGDRVWSRLLLAADSGCAPPKPHVQTRVQPLFWQWSAEFVATNLRVTSTCRDWMNR